MIRIAIQSKGRLNENSLQLLKESGIEVPESKRGLLSSAKGFPLEVVYLRDDDIPQAVAMGVADLGIVGQNEVAERGYNVKEILPLGFGACRISLAIPKSVDYSGLTWFNGKRIATSYPVILQHFLDEKGINAEIHVITGSVEIAPALQMGDAIFDIVSSGSTLIANGLVEVEKIFFSEAVLIQSPNLVDDEKLDDIEQLCFRFKSNLESRGLKYVLMNIPQSRVDAAVALLPGAKSPTILPLALGGWCSIHAVIAESDLWEKIGQLKQIGAEDILVLNLENMIR